MAINDSLFTCKSTDWGTPPDFFAMLEGIFGPFTLDPAANKHNAKCPIYYTEKDNGLTKDWKGRVFLNPPYGMETGDWMNKAYHEAVVHRNAEMVVCLVAARTDTQWWHAYCMQADELYFVKGRLKFSGSQNSAPFPNAVVVFRNPSMHPAWARTGKRKAMGSLTKDGKIELFQ